MIVFLAAYFKVAWLFLVSGGLAVAGMLAMLAVTNSMLREFVPPVKVPMVMACYAAQTGFGRLCGFLYQIVLPHSDAMYTFLVGIAVFGLAGACVLALVREPEATPGSVRYVFKNHEVRSFHLSLLKDRRELFLVQQEENKSKF